VSTFDELRRESAGDGLSAERAKDMIQDLAYLACGFLVGGEDRQVLGEYFGQRVLVMLRTLESIQP